MFATQELEFESWHPESVMDGVLLAASAMPAVLAVCVLVVAVWMVFFNGE